MAHTSAARRGRPASNSLSIYVVAGVMLAVCLGRPAVADPTRTARPHETFDTTVPDTTSRAEPDDLYRRRGYGSGGLVFGLGQGGTAQAGACADLGFARPRTCGPRGDYGIYGNGLGYGFGFR